MASSNSSCSFLSTQKRSACDRCRKQKLRCPFRVDDTQSCDRCVRAGVPCVTGYTQPLGRSCQGILGQRSSNHKTPTAARASGLRHQPTDPSPPRSSGSQSAAETVSATVLDPSPGGSNFEVLLPKDTNESPSFTNYNFDLDDIAYSYMEPELLLSLPQSIDLDYHVDIGGCQIAEPCSPRTTENEHPAAMKCAVVEEPKALFKKSKPLSWVECDLRLAQLNVDLCRQMEVCTMPDQHSREEGQPPGARFTSASPQADQNLFGDALSSTSEFLAIFQSSIGRSDELLFAGDVDSSVLPSFTCLLNLLACYARIITIFNSLLLSLYHQLRSCSASTSEFSKSSDHQTLPGLQLGGFVVQQGSLQTKILIQTIEHQFETIEKTLGLPIELRVSGKQDIYHEGILHEEMNQESLATILTSSFGSIHQAIGTGKRTHFTGSVASLRGTIHNVRQMLDA